MLHSSDQDANSGAIPLTANEMLRPLPGSTPGVHYAPYRRNADAPPSATSSSTSGETQALPPVRLDEARGHESLHLLILPAGVGVDDVAALAHSRFASARWAVVPNGLPASAIEQMGQATSTTTTAMPRIAATGEPGELRLSRHSRVTGPFAGPGPSSLEGAGPEGVILGGASTYVIKCPRERWFEAPYPGGDRDGLIRAFPEGLPNREEERVLSWLLAAARRLGGSVIVDVPSRSVALTPDPDAATDLTLYSGVWLDPDACQRVVRSVDARAAVATEGEEYLGPGSVGAVPDGIDHEPLDPKDSQALHAAASAFEREVLSHPHVLDGYGVNIDLGDAGWILVEVSGEEHLPHLLTGRAWASFGAVVYRVRWAPADEEQANTEHPSPEFAALRRDVGALVRRVTKAIWAVTLGEIADDADFLIDPAVLA